MKPVFKSILLASSLLAAGTSNAQTDALAFIRSRFEAHRTQSLTEKLFVHTDRSFYMTGELMTFRMFCVDGQTHKPLDMSKVAYLEVVDKDKKAVLQTKISLSQGAGNGALFLPASLNSGNYLVRAYTNWMKNSGPDYFFEKAVTIVNPFRQLALAANKDSTTYDVQFFPEGGDLVAGLPSKVGFRMTDVNGRGVSLRGAILSDANDTVARFQPTRFGIGTFQLTPQPGRTYRAVVVDAANRRFTPTFPAIQSNGYAMQLTETGNGRLSIRVRAKASTGQPVVYLLAHTRQDIKLAEYRSLVGDSATFEFDANALGEGISHLTLFDGQRQPRCERLYFRQPAAPLPLSVQTDQARYPARSRVGLTVSANTTADISVSVYRLDSLQTGEQGSILSYLWLSSDLRGTVEAPDYYFQKTTPETPNAADDLMLTHGWRRFRWNDVLQDKKSAPSFLPEVNGHLVSALVVNPATGAGVDRAEALLSVVGKPTRVYAARSDAKGRMLFELTDFNGPKELVAITMPEDSIYRVEIQSPFFEQFSNRSLSRFDLTAANETDLINRSIPMQVQNAYFREQLTRYRLPVVDSLPFFGKADERYRLDDYTRFTTMEDVFREYVPGIQARKRREGYRIQILNLPYRAFFEEPSLMLVDGVPTFEADKIMALSPLKIQRLEVMTRRYFIGPLMFGGIINLSTYKGDLSGFRLDARTTQTEYEGLQWQREFYTPRYDTPERQRSRMPDLRNQLFWAPSLKPDANGQVKVDFFTSDQTGTYLVVANGLTTSGQAGFATTIMEVRRPIK